MGALGKLETVAVLGLIGGAVYIAWKYGGAIVGAVEAPFKALGAGAEAVIGAGSGAVVAAGNAMQTISDLPANVVSTATGQNPSSPIGQLINSILYPLEGKNAAGYTPAEEAKIEADLLARQQAAESANMAAAIARDPAKFSDATLISLYNPSGATSLPGGNMSMSQLAVAKANQFQAATGGIFNVPVKVTPTAVPVVQTVSGSGNSGAGAIGSGNANVSPVGPVVQVSPGVTQQTFDISTAAGYAAFQKAYGH